MPKRIQLRRTKGWRKPARAVVVARPTKWGNQFAITSEARTFEVNGNTYRSSTFSIVTDVDSGLHAIRQDEIEARTFAVELYRQWLYREAPRHLWVEIGRELAGRDLACWCGPGPCHADVLLEVANA